MNSNQINLIKLQSSFGNVWVTEPNGATNLLDDYELDTNEVCNVVSDKYIGQNDTGAPVYEITFSSEDGCILVGTWLNEAHYKNDKISFGMQ